MKKYFAALILVFGGACSAAALPFHSADTSRDFRLQLGEVLRLIQFFNSGGYRCGSGVDGYEPGAGSTECERHNSDYLGEAFKFELEELLRAIQLFNFGGYNPDASGVDGFVLASPLLLPDLFFNPTQLFDTQYDINYRPGRVLFRFTTSMPNIGVGELRIVSTAVVDTPDREFVEQAIKRVDGTSYRRPLTNFRYVPSNMHMITSGWADYRIRELLPQDGIGPVLAAGEKVDVFITSSILHDGSLPNVPPTNQRLQGGIRVQGISIGYADLYPKSLDFQWIDITGLSAGTYWLEVEVEAAGTVWEVDDANNITRVKIELNPPAPQEI